MSTWLGLLFSISLLVTVSFALSPEVQTPEFKAVGFEYHDANGTLISHAYLGLPYAQPPVGNLRMEKPVPLPHNSSRVVQESELPPGCIQQEDLGLAEYPVSEDCLFVNVLTPPEPSDDPEGYPILVWIHGGGFVYGMSRFYGWQTMSRHFNTKKIIVVSFQYRLTFFGFFALRGKHLPGNLGLYDQVAALRWIKKRIHLFGGNPKRVTVWGNSAGSVSVQSHNLSPHSNKLFQQGIQSSGSLYNFWAKTQGTYDVSRQVANAVGCTSNHSSQVKQCLKNVTIPDLWEAVKPLGPMRYGMDELLWTPVLNKDFYGGIDILKITKKAPKKPILYGTTKLEGLVITLTTSNVITSVFTVWTGVNVEDQSAYSKANWTHHLNTYAVTNKTAVHNYAQIKALVQGYYERDEHLANTTDKFWYTRYTEFQTDAQYYGGISKEIAEKKKLGWEQYVYNFRYIHPSHRPLFGYNDSTPHAYEYQYLADAQPYFAVNQSDFTSDELEITKRLVNGFAKFVKSGNPSTNALPWPAVNDGEHIDYVSFGEQIAPGNTFFNEKRQLWKKLYKLGYGQDL